MTMENGSVFTFNDDPSNNEHLFNETSYEHRYRTVPLALLSLVFSVIIAVTIVGNIFVIAAYIRDARIRANVANLFILNLSVTDVLVGIFSLTFNLSRFIKGFWVHGEIICKLWSILDYAVVNTSWLTMILISWDRFCLVSMGLKYQSFQTKKRVGSILVFVWCFVVTYWALVAFTWGPISGQYNVDYSTICLMEYLFNPLAPIFMNLVYFCVSFVLLFVINMAVYYKVRQRSGGIVGQGAESITPAESSMRPNESQNAHGPERSTHCSSHNECIVSAISRPAWSQAQGSVPARSERAEQEKQERRGRTKHQKAAIVLGILSGCFLLCWFPYIATSVIFSICDSTCIPDIVWEITEALAWCNSTINPFIYAATNVHFRRNFRQFLFLDRLTRVIRR